MRSHTKKTLAYYWSHLKRYRWFFYLRYLSLAAVVLLDVTAPYFYKLFFDTLNQTDTPNQTAISSLVSLLLIIASIHFVSMIFRRLGDWLGIYYDSRVMRNIFTDCFRYLHLHSYRFFTNHFAGSLVKKVNRMVFSYETIVDRVYYNLYPLGLRITAVLIILFYFQPRVAVVLLGWTVFFLALNYAFTMYRWKYDVQKAEADSRNTGVLADTITNALNIKLFSALGFEMNAFRAKIEDWRRKLTKTWKLETAMEALQGIIVIALEFIVFYIAIDLWRQGRFTIGDFVWIQAYLLDLFMRLWDFGRNIRHIYVALADAEEMTDILNTKHEVVDLKSAKPLDVRRGKIEFKNISFAYKKRKSVFGRLSLKIKPGERIALVGKSGGGKTTITKLILRFFDIQKGQILIDGQNIAKVTQDSLRQAISFVPQDPILFHRTLMENIRYGKPDATDEEVIAAAKLAHCHEFISRFPKKYDTFVGERGVKLSGGERQRVAIARAILANAPLLILDEATSSLDSHSEALIQEALENLMRHKTTIVIAHRLSTIMKMDRILVLKKGEIVEEGSHRELTQKEGGIYKQLWDLQVGGYI